MDKLKQRIISIDILRGAIMIIMALDHTRDYFHIDAILQDPTNLTTTTPALFFTRWITHFCAPVFVFLSGTSIYLQSLRKTKKELALFLLTRGLWLIIAELTFITLGWGFSLNFDFFYLQVIWAIGWSMIILSGLLFLGYRTMFIIGILIVLFHNLMDYFIIPDPELNILANIFLITNYPMVDIGFANILIAYAILPWTGIMLLGYTTGILYTEKYTAAQRRKILYRRGGILILLFIALRAINLYGDPRPWEVQSSGFLSFLNTTKYPPSLIYTFMTLGPSLIILGAIEGISNRLTSIMNTIGRVPFFYYIIHIYIIHGLCVILFFLEGYTLADTGKTPMQMMFRPDTDFGFQLGYVYLVWLLVVILCYFPCRWYNNYKSTHKKWWLSYL